MCMSKNAGQEWDYVNKLKALTNGQHRCKCKFCDHVWDGGANRIRAHILVLKGYGVARSEADKALHRFFFVDDIPFWKARSPYFQEFVTSIRRVGPSYKVPSYNHLRDGYLKEETKCIESDFLILRDKWKTYGSNIFCDDWSNTRNRPIINIMVSCIYGTMFLESIDTSGQIKTSEYIFEILKDAIMDVGPQNVVQVCMNNEANCVRAGCLIVEPLPHIFYTPVKIVTFVTMKPTILAIYRKFKKKELVKPTLTRFGYMFIMLSNLIDDTIQIVHICAPILNILHLVDREGSTMGLIYEMTNRMVEKIGNMKGIDSSRLEDNDGEVNDGWMDLMERCTNGDIEKQSILCDELNVYKSMEGTFDHPIAKDDKRVQYLALCILSQGTWASPCERNWSTFSLIYTKRRIRLLPKNTEKLVYIHTNLCFATKLKERGFEKMEATLHMIEKEKDDDRLLLGQENHEGEEFSLTSASAITERLMEIQDHDDGGEDADGDEEIGSQDD
ncbi:hypothetical protein KP509_23G057700 [Ceratopteris richardii]|uniref:DUF659 domain-containing protein n=1 Tax=Ceratopteris richardii TaxID=49495 RepID=A0A8T2S058_CERRI|nr:hypothetical protein KP509_23G057700 [Ceratopteris richardii]